jgi:hypothetical protein
MSIIFHTFFTENISEKLRIFSPHFHFKVKILKEAKKCCKSYNFLTFFFSERKGEK